MVAFGAVTQIVASVVVILGSAATVMVVADRAWTFDEGLLPAPSRWHHLRVSSSSSPLVYPSCASGQQSPTNIRRAPRKSYASQSARQFLSTGFVPASNWSVANDGQTLRISFNDATNTVDLEGQRYMVSSAMLQVPSGHAIGGTKTDGELVLLLIRSGAGSGAPIAATISVLLSASDAPHAALQTIIANAPSAPNRDAATYSQVPAAAVTFNSAAFSLTPLFPSTSDIATYRGSLPFPPCTPDVLHAVAVTPIRVGRSQIAAIRLKLRLAELSSAPEYMSVAREVQPWQTVMRNVQSDDDGPLRLMLVSTIPGAVPAPPTDEPLEGTTILALAACVVSGTSLAGSLVALLISLCWPRNSS